MMYLFGERTVKPAVLLGLVVALFACSGEDLPTGGKAEDCLKSEASFVTGSLATADAIDGAALYAKWWLVSANPDAVQPTTDNPMWSFKSAGNNPNTNTGAATWRCKECHGWDYLGVTGAYGNKNSSHYTGFPGVYPAKSKKPVEVYCAIHSGTTARPEHVFVGDSLLARSDALDIAKFITESDAQFGMIDATQYIDIASQKPINANEPNGAQRFEQGNCATASCHGASGDLQEEALGVLADENPAEFIHSIRFGHADNKAMPAFAKNPWNFSADDARDITLYVQNTLPGVAGTGAGNVVRGGQLYDKWWLVADIDLPTQIQINTTYNLLYDTIIAENAKNGITIIKPTVFSETYRCKQCHGWDYAGNLGAYRQGANFTGVKGLLDSRLKTAETLHALIADSQQGLHSWIKYLTDADIDDLVAFIQVGMVNTNDYIVLLTSRVSTYDAVRGQFLYNEIPQGVYVGLCATCHGANGDYSPPDGNPVFIGPLSRDNPWEVLHKIRFGNPGTVMPKLFNSFSVDDAVNILGYTQTLPLN